jgi:hypothetical protein
MLSLSFNQRAITPQYATAFVSRVRQIIETRDWAAEL